VQSIRFEAVPQRMGSFTIHSCTKCLPHSPDVSSDAISYDTACDLVPCQEEIQVEVLKVFSKTALLYPERLLDFSLASQFCSNDLDLWRAALYFLKESLCPEVGVFTSPRMSDLF